MHHDHTERISDPTDLKSVSMQLCAGYDSAGEVVIMKQAGPTWARRSV